MSRMLSNIDRETIKDLIREVIREELYVTTTPGQIEDEFCEWIALGLRHEPTPFTETLL